MSKDVRKSREDGQFEFVGTSYAIPFGRYGSAGDESEVGNEEVMVGRDEQRASFIHKLISMGRRGAFLVTGHRGMGKSSFVQYCLGEYRDGVFKRYLRSHMGKSLWDRLVVILLAAFVVLSALLMSDLLKVLSGLAGREDMQVLWLLAVPAVVVCGYPLLYAKHVFDTVIPMRLWHAERPPVWRILGSKRFAWLPLAWIARIAAFLALPATVLLVWFVFPFGAPTIGLAKLLVLVCASYAFVQGCSLIWRPPGADRESGRSSRGIVGTYVGLTVGALVLTWILISLMAPEAFRNWLREVGVGAWLVWYTPDDERKVAPLAQLSLLACFAGASFVLGQFARFLLLRYRRGRRVLDRELATARGWYLVMPALIVTVMAIIGFHSDIQCIDGGGPVDCNTKGVDDGWNLFWLYLCFNGAFVIRLLLLLRERERLEREAAHSAGREKQVIDPLSFSPSPRFLFLIKAVFSVVVALQLLSPMVTEHTGDSENTKPAVATDGLHFAGWRDDRCKPEQKEEIPQEQKVEGTQRATSESGGNGNDNDKGANGKKGNDAPNVDTKAEATHAGQSITLDCAVRKGLHVFDHDTEEYSYTLFAILLLLVFFYIEYEWVVRPFVSARDDRSIDPRRRPAWEDQITGDAPPEDRNHYKALERLSLPWFLCKGWLPTLVTTVNLGFDRLDHRSVVQGMLVGLRESYYSIFLAWNSPFAAVYRFASLLAIMFLVAVLSDAWFELPKFERLGDAQATETTQDSGEQPERRPRATVSEDGRFSLTRQDYCGHFEAALKRLAAENSAAAAMGSVPAMICALRARENWETSRPTLVERVLFPVLYFEILAIPGYEYFEEESQLVDLLLHPNYPLPSEYLFRHQAWGQNDDANKHPVTLSFRVFHLILFVLAFAVWRWVFSRIPVFPHRRNLQKIDDLLDSLSSTTRTRRKRTLWEPAQWVRSMFVDDVARESEREPVDSRSVEVAFLSILEDIQKDQLLFPGSAQQRISIPAPEVTFVFDEVDKISPQVEPFTTTHEEPADQVDALNFERQRTLAMHTLLSDMKRMISSAPARFIFVGGRMLHDEWLADLTTRQPLLTSIFDVEIYLPSLLSDHGEVPEEFRRLDTRVREFLVHQRYAAEKRFQTCVRRRMQPSYGLRWDKHVPPGFVQRRFRKRPVSESGSTAEGFDVPEPVDLNLLALDAMRNPPSVPAFPERFHVDAGDADVVRILSSLLRVVECRTGQRPGWCGEVALRKELGRQLRRAIRETAKTESEYLARLEPITESAAAIGEDLASVWDTRTVWERGFIDDFVYFLAYRSIGTPKKLKDLLATFVYPVGRVTDDPKSEWSQRLACHEVLYFGDNELFRIQLIGSVYRHLANAFERRLVRRDDKIASTVFYMMDFLFKFHGRAFAWDDLERIDELAHIHRAPDLRQVLVDVVGRCSERFLHRVLNGMYSYRFRSDLAKEIEYISRNSGEEMAAFNFTLDETRSLKALYANQLKASAETNHEVVAGLGELYEYDQEYEVAREHYRQALHLLDAEFEKVLGRDYVEGGVAHTYTQPALKAVLSGEFRGLWNAALFMPWGVLRLRLMLQIGMTYERARNMEMAEAEYRMARLFSYNLLCAYIGEQVARYSGAPNPPDDAVPVPEPSTEFWTDSPWPSGPQARVVRPLRNRHAAKHLSILYQAVFASGWVSEKLVEAVDTSTTIVERDILRIRRLLPLQRGSKARATPEQAGHANFHVILSELHNKAGDLYFFKGRQSATVDDIRRHAAGRHGDSRQDGYLVRAQYHYAVGMHEIREYIRQRRRGSARRFQWRECACQGNASRQETFRYGAWPNFIYLVASNAITDLAEVLLGRVSLYGLFAQLNGPPNDEPAQRRDVVLDARDGGKLADRLKSWFEGSRKASQANIRITLNECTTLDLGCISDWVGKWNKSANIRDRKGGPALLLPGRTGTANRRLLAALNLSVGGCRFFEEGGFPEDAAQEYMQVAETINRYLWWTLAARRVEALEPEAVNKRGLPGVPVESPLFGYLLDLAHWALEQAKRLFERNRASKNAGDGYLVGGAVPRSFLTLSCALGLAAVGYSSLEPHVRKFVAVVEAVTGWKPKEWDKALWAAGNRLQGEDDGECGEYAGYLEEMLKYSLRRHRYPMLNRLNALKVLIDYSVLVLWSPRRDGASRRGAGTESLDDAERWGRELVHLEELFSAELHFTPLNLGTTLATLALSLKKADRAERFSDKAHSALTRSIEMYTMGRAYYEGISELYYLYDDFNDRHVHYEHSIQMAGTELATVLLQELAALKSD